MRLPMLIDVPPTLLALAALLFIGCAAADAPLLDAGPESECEPGQRRCLENQAQVCTGGGFWSLPQSCNGAECVEGSCQVSCAGNCMPGSARCAPEGLQRCDTGADGCGVWSAPAPCPDGERCIEGQCAMEGCEADCTPGSRRCVGPAAYTECRGEDCPRWSPAVDCPDGAACQAGRCGDGGGEECTDQCRPGELVCLGSDQFQRCQMQEIGCLDYSPAEDCPPGRVCAPGEGCVLACDEPECDEGAVRCFQGGQQTCVQTPDGCVVWGAVIACDDGAQCRGGSCEEVCIPECVAGERRCVEIGVQTCERIDDCEQWGGAEPCPGGTQCQGAGNCGVCVDGQEEERACGRCGTQRRRCSNGSWGNWGLCGDEGVCDAGAQRACGNCGVETCSNQCQWGGCQNEGVCAPGEVTEPGTCGDCGWRTCNAQCQWNADCGRDGGMWQRCNDCGWQFCCPGADWCPCAGNFPDQCGGATCGGDGFCQ